MHARPRPSRARMGGRGTASAALLAALAVAVPGSAFAAADAPDGTVVIEGTAIQLIGDGKPLAEGEGFSAETTTVMVDVDGRLVALPAGIDTAALEAGDTVALTVRTAGALSTEESLADLTTEGLRAQVVGVEAVAEAAETDLKAVSTGAHQLIILPVHWAGTDGTTQAELKAMADATATFWEAQSGGRMDVQQTVPDWKPIANPGSVCSDDFLVNVYNRALAAHAVTGPAPTRHIAVYFPEVADCGFAGLAQIEGGVIWLNGWPQTFVLAHEYGHNVGLGHANSLDCAVGTTRVPLVSGWTPGNANCAEQEYGDYADVMGQGNPAAWDFPGNLNSGFADALGYAHVNTVASAPVIGTDVAVAALANVNAVRAIKVGLSGSTLYADYRPAAFPDNQHRPAWAGVQVRTTAKDSRGVLESYLLDMQPATSPFTKVSLPVGVSWEIPATGVSLQTKSVAAGAVVTVGPGAATEQVKRYITKVYQDLFKRGVDPTGLQGWTQALLSGTPRIAVANAITYSDEYRRTLIAGSYQTYLGRGPDPAGADGWLDAMRKGATIQQMEAGFIASSEYYAKAGGTDAAWVKKLYQHVLGRTAADSEVQAWTRALAQGGSRYQVAMGFLVSYEHLTDVVNTYYVSLLGRGIDPSGAHSWVIAIQGGARVEAVIGGIIASDEYYSKV